MANMLSDVIEKVKKILSVAENSDKPGEVAAAQSLAQEIMTRYQIEEAQLNGHKGEGDIISFKLNINKPYVNDKAILLNYIAKHNFCKVLQGDSYCMIYGYKNDIELCVAVYKILSLDMITEMKYKLNHYRETTNDKIYTRGWIKSFFAGYSITIGERFKYAKTKVVNDYESKGTSVELVVRDKEHAVEKFFQDICKIKPRTRKVNTMSGYDAGVNSARNANIGQTQIKE